MITYEEYQALTDSPEDIAKYETARAEFKVAHPDAPDAEPVECLNLIMKREYAEQILAGDKKLEIRNYSQHYFDRLEDKKVAAYEDKHWDDESMRDQLIMFSDTIRPVKKIHFHNYGNSWYLDIECTENGSAVVEDNDIKFLQEKFGFHEFDEELIRLNKKRETNRPMFYYFALGEIIDTNLPR